MAAVIERSPAEPGLTLRRGRPWHVLMVHCRYRHLGGEDLSFEAETDLLRRAGLRVTVYARDNHELDDAGPLRMLQAGLGTVWAADAYREVRDLVRRERPDLVHFQNTFPLVSPAPLHAVRRLGRPVVLALKNYRILCAGGGLFRDGHVCNDCVGRPLPMPALRHVCYHGSLPRTAAVAAMQTIHRAVGTWTDAVDRFVTPSEFARSRFVAAGFPADRIAVKPEFVHPDPGRAPRPRDGCLFVGRLAPEKGIMTLLRAWTAPDLPTLRIAGHGPLRPEIERFIAASGLGDRVELLPQQDPDLIPDLMQSARCLVFPSEGYETFGRVAAEAMACSVPVVASRLGAMVELVTDGVDGRLFEPGDPAALADSVRAVLAATAADDAMCRAARATYEARFTAERNLEMLLAIYEEAISGSAKA